MASPTPMLGNIALPWVGSSARLSQEASLIAATLNELLKSLPGLSHYLHLFSSLFLTLFQYANLVYQSDHKFL